MQKVINVIALLSGLTSAALIAGSGYLLLNKDTMIENLKTQATQQATQQATKIITGQLPEMIKGQLPAPPKLPTKTGPVLDFEKGFTK